MSFIIERKSFFHVGTKLLVTILVIKEYCVCIYVHATNGTDHEIQLDNAQKGVTGRAG